MLIKKFVTHSIIKGKKKLIKNSFLKLSKICQKYSKKNFKNIIKLVVVFSMVLFKNSVTKINNIKNSYYFIKKNQIRLSLAIKHLIKLIKKNTQRHFYFNFYKEIILLLKNSTISNTFMLKQKYISFYYK